MSIEELVGCMKGGITMVVILKIECTTPMLF
jgi:hypothetical protein